MLGQGSVASIKRVDHDQQAKSLANVEFFEMSEACQPQMDKYIKQ